ncbi:(Fe-S)-binding protein [Deferribacterales bacterium RsTz2092]
MATKVKRGCVQCGECLQVCPVFKQYRKEEYSPKAKRILMEQLAGGTAQLSWGDMFSLARLCAGCGRCKQACSGKLSAGDLLADMRSKHSHWSQYMWDIWINRLGPLWGLFGRLAMMVPLSIAPSLMKSTLETAKAMANKTDIKTWAIITKSAKAKIDVSKPVVLFAGCTANNVRPQWGQTARQLLEAWGYTLLDTNGFNCCGGTMHHAGRYEVMRTMQDQNINEWRKLGKPHIAVFCASCYHSLKAYADSEDDNAPLNGDDGQEWLASLTPLAGLLTDAIATVTADKPAKYGYHEPCHWEQKDGDRLWLSDLLSGLNKGEGLCCGMGGILKMTDPDLSNNMARSCMEQFSADLRYVLTSCSGCTMQLSAVAAQKEVYHWLDVVKVGR